MPAPGATSIKGSDLFERLFLALPLPFSKMVYSFGRNTMRKDARTSSFEKAFQHLRQQEVVDGDYLEFGVYRGTGFMTNWNLAQQFGFTKMRFFAFDSFAGLPEGEVVWEPGMYACSKERFLNIVRKAGADLNRVIPIEGIFSQSLTPTVKKEHNLTRAAFIHVDCDLYTSTKDVLAWVTDLVQPGTVLAFDDWNCFEGNDVTGEPKAFNEWPLKDQFVDLYETGQQKGFVCVR